MGLMNGLLMGIGAAGTTYGENRIKDQREAMRAQAEVEKENRIREASHADASLARQQHLTDYDTLKADDAKKVLLAHDVALQDKKDADNYKYDPENAARSIKYEGELAKAKATPESASLAAYHYAQADHLRAGGSDGGIDGGWDKNDTKTLHANNSLTSTFEKQLKSYDDAIEGTVNEEEKIALQGKRASVANTLAQVQASTQALVDKHTLPTDKANPQTGSSYVDNADPSGRNTKLAYDTITEMTKDGKIKSPELNDMTLADMNGWIKDNNPVDTPKKQDAEQKIEAKTEDAVAMPGLTHSVKKHAKNDTDNIQAEYLLNHGASDNLTNSADIERASKVEDIRSNKSLSKEAKILAIQDIIDAKSFGGMLRNGAKNAYGIAQNISNRITDNAKSALSDYTQ